MNDNQLDGSMEEKFNYKLIPQCAEESTGKHSTYIVVSRYLCMRSLYVRYRFKELIRAQNWVEEKKLSIWINLMCTVCSFQYYICKTHLGN